MLGVWLGLDSLLALQRNDLLRPLMDWVCITRGAGGGEQEEEEEEEEEEIE